MIAAMDLSAFRPVVLLLAASAPGLCAAADCLRLERGWARATPTLPMAAGYGVLRNQCPHPLVVVSVRSPDFGTVSLHESVQEGGVSRMRAVERLPLPAGGSVLLQPGGLHLMLMEAKGELPEGARLHLTFGLEDGGQAAAELRVARSAPQP